MINIIAGSPLSGKSTYVETFAKRGELVYDYDKLHIALSLQESHQHLKEIRPFVIKARNAIFDKLENEKESIDAWIITSTPKMEELKNVANRFGAKIVFLEIEREEAHRRCEQSRPAEWHDYIENWFDQCDIDHDIISEINRPFESEEKMSKNTVRRKTYRAPMRIKAGGEPGEVIAEFATLNVIDLDGDVTPEGAFTEGQEVIIEPWNHGWDLPAGKGKIFTDGKKARMEGRYFLDTEAGEQNYLTVKNMGDLAEWSYTFNVLEQRTGEFEGETANFLMKLDTIGVSPVNRGAGIDTRTVGIKGGHQKAAIRSHSTPTTEEAWDGPANVANAKSGEGLAYYARIFAWRDAEGDQTVKSTYKYPHHMVDGDGNPGAANVKGCQAGIGALNGARGETTIPDADRQGVYNHLAKHLADADLEAPELKSLAEIDRKSTSRQGEIIKPRAQVDAEIDLLEIELINLEVNHG